MPRHTAGILLKLTINLHAIEDNCNIAQ